MAKILKFPTPAELKKKEQAEKLQEDYKIVERASDDCIAASHFLLEVLEEFINTGEVSQNFMDMNFRDETFQESRDMFVIVNMLNAMFNRYYAIPHGLHREMDRVYTKIKLMSTQNEQARIDLEREYDILFTPDFDEDPDDTD
jgi:hypothetical protein